MRTELRAGLMPHSIDVCIDVDATAADNRNRPLARVSVDAVDAQVAHYRLEVTDAVTNKHTSRDVRLGPLPLDGRNLALAVASEELLRASWAELALQRTRPVERPAPSEPPVKQGAPAPLPLPLYKALGVRVAFEHFTGGQSHFGADLFARLPLGSLLAVQVGLGPRRGLSVSTAHGAVASTALGADAGLSLSLLRRSAVEAAAFASARLMRLTFEPQATGGATARAEHGLAATARAGLAVALGAPGRLRCYTTLGAGLPLRAFSASDSGEVVTGASQLELFGSTGLAWELP